MWDDEWFWAFYDEEMELEEYDSDSGLTDDLYRGPLIILSLYVKGIGDQTIADRKAFGEQLDETAAMIRNYIEGRLAETPPRLFYFLSFCKQQGLKEWQIWMLLFAGVRRYYPESAELFAQIYGDKKQTEMTMDLAYRLCRDLYGDDREILSDMRRQTTYWQLFFEKNNELLYGADRGAAPLRLRDEVYRLFLGSTEKLTEHRALELFYDGSDEADPMVGREEELARLARLWESSKGRQVCIAVTGARHSGRKLLVRQAASLLNKKVFFVDFSVLCGMEESGGELEKLCFCAGLLDAGICLTGYGAEKRWSEEERWDGRNTAFEEAGQWIASCRSKYSVEFLATAPPEFCGVDRAGLLWVCLPLKEPDADQMFALWNHFTKNYGCSGILAAEMAGRYRLNAGDIRHVFDMAKSIAESYGRGRIEAEDIVAAVKGCSQKLLGEYADVLDLAVSWQELVVEPDTEMQLRYIENRLKYKNTVGGTWGFDKKFHYGKGVCALFYGPAGTGKTMAASVLANELGLTLYRVDLSRMVSKYIGETQKHISELFEHAKGTNALLFFDEADALFAKRTEVGDAHDRNANSEVAHLLQKLEEYDGISILATNLKDNIDDAFKRRIKYMIPFRMPDAETRRLLWKQMLPKQAPAEEDLDLAFFAEKFELSGSEIKDAVLHAAYMAAAEGTEIGNRHVMEAVRLGCAKYGKVLTKENFGYMGV